MREDRTLHTYCSLSSATIQIGRVEALREVAGPLPTRRQRENAGITEAAVALCGDVRENARVQYEYTGA